MIISLDHFDDLNHCDHLDHIHHLDRRDNIDQFDHEEHKVACTLYLSLSIMHVLNYTNVMNALHTGERLRPVLLLLRNAMCGPHRGAKLT